MSGIFTKFPGIRSLSLVSTLVLISFLTIGGCSENNGGGMGGPAPGPETSCTTATEPCASISSGPNNTVICDNLGTVACVADLNAVIAQVDPDGTLGINGDTVMWMEAWGTNGGNSAGGTSGGAGGYAITTTTVNDLKSINGNSSFIYYFLGNPGGNGGTHCGSSGGGGTIVTTEDLALNPTSDPTQSAPPVLLVAGGGGGGAAGQNFSGFCGGGTGRFVSGAAAGVAIAHESGPGQGVGASTVQDAHNTLLSFGGNSDDMGAGGAAGCLVCNSQNNQKAGTDGFGGLGGRGGSGPGCGGPQLRTFVNLPGGLFISFTSGMGGNGSFDQNACASGGGGGGGGYGGGGGGAQGNNDNSAVAGAGGGSFAIQSTQTSNLSPTSLQPNPCGIEGCVRITFAP